MRGLTQPPGGTLLDSSLADERGATLALVAVSLLWMIGMAALIVDVGDGWLGRQNLISASDAAALAAAQDVVDQRWNEACATAQSYIADNAPDATQTECDITPLGTDGGRVSVSVTTDVESRFIDLDGTTPTVGATSTAAWGPPATVTTLRPFALCHDGSAALEQLIDNPPTVPTAIDVTFLRDDPTDCGGSIGIGNFATIDFEGGASTTAIRNWMLRGYPGQIGFDPPTTTACASPAVCFDRPYASTIIRPELQLLRSQGIPFMFPIYDYADVDRVHVIGIVRARLLDYQLDGDPGTWWIRIEVAPGLVAGTCCGPAERRGGNKVIAICGVDPEVFDTCEELAG